MLRYPWHVCPARGTLDQEFLAPVPFTYSSLEHLFVRLTPACNLLLWLAGSIPFRIQFLPFEHGSLQARTPVDR